MNPTWNNSGGTGQHRAGFGQVFGVGDTVTISPSRMTVGRVDPSLSFQVQAGGAQFFDVILATDPALLDAANAHRRNSRNFRSSRQDFLGEPIEVEAGFYLMPRVFLRDVISADPRPTRLYYLAAAYDDKAGGGARYSVPLNRLSEVPFVTLAGDLVAANLSKVMGVAVERLGRVAGGGQVVAALGLADLGGLPVQIGGLPVARRVAPMAQEAAPVAPAYRATAMAAQQVRATPVKQKPAVPLPQRARPVMAAAMKPSGPFVDEDFGADVRPASGGWQDVDQGRGQATGFDYDDGFAAPAVGAGEAPASVAPAAAPRTIPPLDPVPVATPITPFTPITPAAAPATDDALLMHVITEGAGGRYEAMNLDGGFRGRLGVNNPYYQRAHDGLRLGPHQVMQDSGALGDLLGLMQRADPAAFAAMLGPVDALMAVVTAQGPSGLTVPGGRGPRVQPVDGADLWQEPWIDRFRNAARHPAFQAAMRAQIMVQRIDPLRGVAQAVGLTAPRGMAMLMALAIHLDVAGAVAHLRAAVNPFDTPARLGAALDALGFADLGQFCAAHGLPPVDTVDDATHFALIGALQALGPQSPVQVADAEAFMDAMVTSAGPGALGDALLKLRLSEAFGNPERRG